MSKTQDIVLRRLVALSGGLKGRRLLEVGCGLGAFLLSAQAEGAEVFGNDISPEVCDFVRKYLEIPVFQVPLPLCASQIGPIDIIVMNDLIEHLVNPLEVIETAHCLLKPGGFVSIWTPNGGAAGSNLETARNWVGFRVDLEHLQYFSPQTIVWLVAQQGWVIEHLETLGYPNLDGIDQPPRQRASQRMSLQVRRLISSVPGARRAVRALRAARRELTNSGVADPRLGLYHLFVVLRRR